MTIQTNNLTKVFTQGSKKIYAVNNINLSISKGESIAITGKSGSGKTTLLSLLAGLDSCTSGEINILHKNITHMNEKDLAKFRANNIGIIFQKFHLLPHLTALENVTLPLEISNSSNVLNKAKEALDLVGLSDRLGHLPRQLSGGENQRVAIARAIVNKPPILFADEPSGNLDQETGEQVMDLIFQLTQSINMSLVLVTHDQPLAMKCQRQVTISNGLID